MSDDTVTLVEPPAGSDPLGQHGAWLEEAFWRELNPGLTISEDLAPNARSNGLEDGAMALARERMLVEGYFRERDPELEILAPRLADAVGQLVKSGVPAPFIFIYDEAWTCFHRMAPTIAGILGPDYRVLPDFWAWHVDPAGEQAGWRPHRDKGFKALGPNKEPLSLTIWIPLSDANPLNGCMYMLPANRDPVYGTEQDNKWQIDLPSIRALPGEPGHFFCWNQAVLHWGARSSRYGEAPRISMAMEFQRADIAPFNMPLMAPLLRLTYRDRLKLIAKQILQYKHMYPLSPEMNALAEKLLSA